MTQKYVTYAEIASSWQLWIEYVDVVGVDTEEGFNKMPLDEKIALIVACFGPEVAE